MLVNTFLSTVQFDHKPTKEEKKHIPFFKQTIEVEELHNHVLSGGAFCNIYDYTGTIEFVGEGSKKNHYIGSQTINVDLDHQSSTMEETFNRVRMKPTFCYTTSSNGLPNEKNVVEYAYRFIYIFDEIIYGKENYINLYHKVCSQEKLKFDKNASSPYQNMFGYKSSQSKFTGQVYSLKDFNFVSSVSMSKILDLNSKDSNLNEQWCKTNNITELSNSNIILDIKDIERCKTNNITTTTHNNISGFAPFIDNDFFLDFKSQEYNFLIDKYKNRLRNIEISSLPYTDEDTMMIELPPDFYEIRRLFSIGTDGKGRCKKILYGQHRKNKLFCNLMIRKLITPNLTPTELLYDLCCEMEYHIDNNKKEKIITKDDLLSIVGYVMNADIEQFRQNYKRPRNRMVNDRYAKKHKMKKRDVANKANAERHHQKREELYALIGEYYDCSLSNEENLEQLKEYGIHISIDTLKRFKKENGLTRTYRKKKEVKEEKNVEMMPLPKLSQEFVDYILSSPQHRYGT